MFRLITHTMMHISQQFLKAGTLTTYSCELIELHIEVSVLSFCRGFPASCWIHWVHQNDLASRWLVFMKWKHDHNRSFPLEKNKTLSNQRSVCFFLSFFYKTYAPSAGHIATLFWMRPLSCELGKLKQMITSVLLICELSSHKSCSDLYKLKLTFDPESEATFGTKTQMDIQSRLIVQQLSRE